MKICYLGDANSIHTKKICCFFRDKGYDVTVISLNDGEIEGVKVYSMGVKVQNESNSISKVKYLKNIFKIKNLVKKIKPDILHAHYASSYGLIGSLINYKPYIISVWGSDIYDFPNRSYINKSVLKYNLNKANLVLSTSKAMAEETNKYTDKNILITPFGVDINKFSPKSDKKEDNGKELIIGTVKTLEDIYGIDILIKAFAIVKDRNTNMNIRLKIAGKGSRETYLKNLSKDLGIDSYIEFLGFINQDEVAKRFRSFDVAVFPSLSESFGVAAVEAQGCGTPVIISSIDGLMEATNPGITSLVFEKGNHKDLANKIEEILNDSALRNNMGISARKYVEDNYNIVDNFSYIDKIYKDIHGKKDKY
jgi:L-malate glycosyltransferase